MISKHQLQSRFRRLAWLSAYLSLLAGVSHVRSFPSYNLIISIIAIFTGVQDDKETILKYTSVCAVLGGLSLVADIIFCSVWAGEIRDSYIGVVKFTLAVFILNMFVKAAIIYSALTVTVVLSVEEDSEGIAPSRCERSISTASQVCIEVESMDDEVITPSKSLNVTFSSEIEEKNYPVKEPYTPYGNEAFSPGIPGLVSPAKHLEKSNQADQC